MCSSALNRPHIFYVYRKHEDDLLVPLLAGAFDLPHLSINPQTTRFTHHRYIETPLKHLVKEHHGM